MAVKVLMYFGKCCSLGIQCDFVGILIEKAWSAGTASVITKHYP